MNRTGAVHMLEEQEELVLDNIGQGAGVSTALDCNGARIVVLSGAQSGASMDISCKDQFTIGTGYDCDVVLRTTSALSIKILIERINGIRRLQLIEGEVSLDGEELQEGEYHKLSVNTPVGFGDVSFQIADTENSLDIDLGNLAANSTNRRWAASSALVAGLLLSGAVGMQAFWQANANQVVEAIPFEQQLQSLGIESVEMRVDPASSMSIVSGRVADRESFRKLESLASAQTPLIALDVQIDAVLMESLQDIYRNHGITPTVEVLGKGHVKVNTVGVAEQRLLDLEKTLKEDLPMLTKLESSNIPPEASIEPTQTVAIDPDKEVEAVIAGESSYVITRDQSRYFVGAVLPSGHMISSISEGVVVMMRDGEETELKF